MNEFFLALNKTVIESDIEIEQITVKDLDKWSQFAEPIRVELENDYSIEKIEEVVVNHKLFAQLLCTLSTIHDCAFFALIMNTDADKFISIFKSVIEVNQAYFDQDTAKKSKEKTDNTWFDSFQFLISKGHRHKDILDYSFGAFLEYLKAAQRNEQNSILSHSGAIRVAYHADKKGFESYTKSLKK